MMLVTETMATDAFGRSVWVASVVAVVAVLCEAAWFLMRAIGHRSYRDEQGETT